MLSKIADWITIVFAFLTVVKYIIAYIPIIKMWNERFGDILRYLHIWPEVLFGISLLGFIFSKIYFRKTEKQRDKPREEDVPAKSNITKPAKKTNNETVMPDDAYVNEFKFEVQTQINDIRAGIRHTDRTLWNWVERRLKEDGVITEREILNGLQFGIVGKSLNGRGLKQINWTGYALEYRNLINPH